MGLDILRSHFLTGPTHFPPRPLGKGLGAATTLCLGGSNDYLPDCLQSSSTRAGTRCWEGKGQADVDGQWEGSLGHTQREPGSYTEGSRALPVQGLLLRDVFEFVLVLLPEAAKLIAGAELVSGGAGELDVKGRGGEVNLGTGLEEKQKKQGEDIVSVEAAAEAATSLGPLLFSHTLVPHSFPPLP